MSNTDRQVPFRAGLAAGESPLNSRALASHPMIGAADVVLAVDASEFQQNIDASYLKWSQAIIIRAAYGANHDDRAWYGGDRRKFLHDNGAKYVGIYQYITAFEDVIAQAKEFCRLVGTMRAGEDLFADIEEGSGNLSSRWQTWANVVHTELGWEPSNYSGLFFASDHGLQPVNWVAAYGLTEPSIPHRWWQFTSSFSVPGIAGSTDCSVFHGGYPELLATAFGSSKPQPGKAPDFPYGSGDYLGLESADPHCHSGFTTADQAHVRTWQAQMKARGWVIETGGTYGTSSQTACRAFQAEKGLAADGKVGPATWAATWTAAVT